jgi:hypothetical protein
VKVNLFPELCGIFCPVCGDLLTDRSDGRCWDTGSGVVEIILCDDCAENTAIQPLLDTAFPRAIPNKKLTTVAAKEQEKSP